MTWYLLRQYSLCGCVERGATRYWPCLVKNTRTWWGRKRSYLSQMTTSFMPHLKRHCKSWFSVISWRTFSSWSELRTSPWQANHVIGALQYCFRMPSSLSVTPMILPSWICWPAANRCFQLFKRLATPISECRLPFNQRHSPSNGVRPNDRTRHE